MKLQFLSLGFVSSVVKFTREPNSGRCIINRAHASTLTVREKSCGISNWANTVVAAFAC